MFHNPVRQPRPLLGPRRFDIVLSNTAVLVASVFVVSLSVPYRRKVADIEQAEKEKMRSKCNKIIDHGINCFINRQLIYNFPVRSWIANKVHIQSEWNTRIQTRKLWVWYVARLWDCASMPNGHHGVEILIHFPSLSTTDVFAQNRRKFSRTQASWRWSTLILTVSCSMH